MAFDLYEFLNKNKFELGTVKKEVGDSVYKGGYNDLRKTSYEVKIVDGKFDLSTHKTIMTESKSTSQKISPNEYNEAVRTFKKGLHNLLEQTSASDIKKIVNSTIQNYKK